MNNGLVQLHEKYSFELDTVRACPYCSFREQCRETDFMIHLANHTEDEKSLLQSGDITRLIDLCKNDIRSHERHRQNDPCCEYDSCLHNVKSAREKQMEIMIKKLEKYVDPNNVMTITAIPSETIHSKSSGDNTHE